MIERNGDAARPSKIWLASGSPRRRELLSKMGVSFEVLTADVDETASGAPDQMVILLSRRKAHAVAARVDGVILAADTLVALDGRAMGKPRDRRDAARMLKELSGRTHEVFTGVCLLDTKTGNESFRVDTTYVTFRALNDDEIEAYVESGEPMDKAGAYGIQGAAGAFVASLEGSFTNVMGLPTELLANMLLEMGI